MPEPVANVVERVPVFGTEHSPGDAVSERVGGDVVGRAAASVGVGLDVGAVCEALHDVVDGLPGHPVGLL